MCCAVSSALLWTVWLRNRYYCRDPAHPLGVQWQLGMVDGDVVHATGLLLATGASVDVRKDPMLATLLSMTPPDSVCEGLPVLKPGCRWPTLCDGRRLQVHR